MAVAVGIDVAAQGKGLDLVGLNEDRKIVASYSRLTVREAAILVLQELRPDIVCIDSPSGWSHSGKSRQSERDLAAMGISSFATGPELGDHGFYSWVRVGISLYEALSDKYPLFRGDEPKGTAAEAFPYATSVVLAGRKSALGESKIKFRRAVVTQEGIDDAGLRTIDQVDAALCALTGILALDGKWQAVGDKAEGMILLPGAGAKPVAKPVAKPDAKPVAKPVAKKAAQKRSSRPAKSPAARQSASKRKNGSGPNP